jgi:hypothetical protein
MFSWYVADKATEAKAEASDVDAGSEADAKDKATALLLSAARQLVVGRGWRQSYAAISTY